VHLVGFYYTNWQQQLVPNPQLQSQQLSVRKLPPRSRWELRSFGLRSE